jgi:hypothetical protein
VVYFATCIAFSTTVVAALPDSTWVALPQLPKQPRAAVFALAVSPSNNQLVLAGDSQGWLSRSTSGGSAWTVVRQGTSSINTISFSPFSAGLVLAGTRGGGALVSRDSGATWTVPRGLDGRNVRVFAFALSIIAAGTDRGVYSSADGTTWKQAGLAERSIAAIAAEAIHDPVRLIAGTDSPAAVGGMPLYESLDGGATWRSFTPAIAGTMTVRLVAGPLPPTGNIRPLLVGTNSGLFASKDNAASFTPLSGGGLLPTTDYPQAVFLATHHDRYYVASDGGGSGAGGLWRTTNAGTSFAWLAPPEPAVTALAVSNEEKPIVYIATFQPGSHRATLWALHDTGGIPRGPSLTPSPVASGVRLPAGAVTLIDELTRSGQLPYLGLALGALAILLTAIAAHLRGRYR